MVGNFMHFKLILDLPGKAQSSSGRGNFSRFQFPIMKHRSREVTGRFQTDLEDVLRSDFYFAYLRD
jgi:hypothetical protein